MRRVISSFILLGLNLSLQAGQIIWRHLSSSTNQLPIFTASKLQSGSVPGDFDGDKTNDFILSFGDVAPALVLYRSTGKTNWTTLPIEMEFLPIAPGGAAYDIDKDDDLDVVFGSDTGPELWWWENPSPAFDPNKSWTRRTIKSEGSNIHRGQIFADILGKGRPQLIYWNQGGSNSLFVAEIPMEVRAQSKWVSTLLMSGRPEQGNLQSLVPTDIDINGDADLLAGNYLLLRKPDLSFKIRMIMIGAAGTPSEDLDKPGRGAIGRFRDGTYAQVVLAPHDSRGHVYWCECKADPGNHQSWGRRQLLTDEIAAAASLAVADLDKDGNDDIFLSERHEPDIGAPQSPRAWIFHSDGQGNFRMTVFSSGLEIFDAKLVDLDNDTDLDILSTPRSHGAPRVDIWLNTLPAPETESHPK